MSSLSFFCFSLTLSLTLAVLKIRQEDVRDISYEQFLVDSTIVARYARTSITSAILNTASVSQELSFQVQLPSTAFISSFTMTVNGTTYIGYVDEKKRAADEFDERKNQGQNVGLVESQGTNLFLIRINAAASSRSTFVMSYEELLMRKLSVYQQIINLNPGSVVKDLRVTVRAIDNQGIIRTKTSDFATFSRTSDKEVVYTYSPSMGNQNDNVYGLSRDMLIEYDVNHPSDNGAGLVIVNDCFFAQFFSPANVPSLRVDIVFVIDTSGSMSGTKILQARESLVKVITDLNSADRFAIVAFSSSTSVWGDTFNLRSVAESRAGGIAFANSLIADGGTNFTGGMQVGIQILKNGASLNKVQLLVMLTDGEPTVGITDPDMILQIARKELDGTRISLNTLGFGTNLNFLLLQQLAIGNRGIAVRIFEGTDAAIQLEGFYKEISSPILHDIRFIYPSDAVEESSEIRFPLLFDGSELVVAGKFNDDVCSAGSIPVVVRGNGTTAELVFQSQIDPSADTVINGFMPSTERLVAYLTIQQHLNTLKVTADNATAIRIRQSALDMAIAYNFVTDLTSLIVVEESSNSTTPVPGQQSFGGDLESDLSGNFPGNGVNSNSQECVPVKIMGVVLSVAVALLISW